MFIASRTGALAGLLVLTVWLAPAADIFTPVRAEPSSTPTQDPADPGQPPPRSKATGKAKRGRGKADQRRKAEPPADPQPEMKPENAPAPQPAPGEISFARQIAPILVANCAGCHRVGRPGLEKGGLDLTTFERMMKGAANGEPAVVAGKPDESHMIMRVKGDETPRMPQGNDVSLSDEAIGRIESWIKAGAKLDAGLDPKAEIASYAASAEEMKRDQLAQLDPEQRKRAIEEAGLERWTKTNPNLKPETTSSDHFILFGVMNKERAAATLRTMETTLAQLKRALGPDAAKWPERISLHVFPDNNDYVEFIRSYKRRDVSPEEAGDADLKTPHPYVVIADPGPDVEPDPTASRRGSARRRGGDDNNNAPEPERGRTATGLLTENLVHAAVLDYGKSPAWLAEGLGLYFAEQVERGGPRYQQLRAAAFDSFRQGWTTKATETLGGGREMAADEFRAISFALVDCLASPQYQRLFPAFAKGMSQGTEKLDDVVKDIYGVTRDVFLNTTGEWVAGAYGGAR